MPQTTEVCFVLGDYAAAGVADAHRALPAIMAHAGQYRRQDRRPISLGKRVKQGINGRLTEIDRRTVSQCDLRAIGLFLTIMCFPPGAT
jgi:hypothetical protein